MCSVLHICVDAALSRVGNRRPPASERILGSCTLRWLVISHSLAPLRHGILKLAVVTQSHSLQTQHPDIALQVGGRGERQRSCPEQTWYWVSTPIVLLRQIRTAKRGGGQEGGIKEEMEREREERKRVGEWGRGRGGRELMERRRSRRGGRRQVTKPLPGLVSIIIYLFSCPPTSKQCSQIRTLSQIPLLMNIT